MKRSQLLAALAAALAATGCSDDDPTSNLRYPTVAVFAPSAGDIPVPNDLLFSGTMDVTLNIPVTDPNDLSDPLVALNSLDGWSTTAPFVLRFSRDVDPATVIAGDSVRMFEVTTLTLANLPVGGPVTGVVRELVAGTEYTLGVAAEYPGSTAFRVTPERALLASTLGAKRTYMVVCTDTIEDTSGFAVSPDREYFIATTETAFDPMNPATQQLAQLQQILLAMEFAADAAGIDRATIVLTASFTTQSVGSQLGAALTIAGGDEAALIASVCAGIPAGCVDTTPSPFSTAMGAAGPAPIATTAVLLGAGPGLANVYVGALTAPYYSTAATNNTFGAPTSDQAPLVNSWRARYPFTLTDTARNLTRFNPLPEATGAERFPLLITLPNVASGQVEPMNGWPVVIFQHGITRIRTDALAVADTLAAAGFAVVSMDLPMHGLDSSSPLFLGYQSGALRERTFGLDLLNNMTGAPGPDGVVDPSGQWFLNLANLQNSRDNLHQGAADLANLRATIGSFTVGGQALDPTAVHFFGHSLGAVVALPYLTLGSGFETITLAEPGGGIPYLLDASVSFGPTLRAGLAAAGVQPGTPDYTSFLFAAQTVVDSADPVNFGAALGQRGIPLLLHEVIGGGPLGGLPDQTIPNTVPGRPLSGTEPLISALGLGRITATVNDVNGVSGAVRFIEGDHGSVLDPTANAAATAEMQSQIASFLASVGTQVTVSDPTVIDTTP